MKPQRWSYDVFWLSSLRANRRSHQSVRATTKTEKCHQRKNHNRPAQQKTLKNDKQNFPTLCDCLRLPHAKLMRDTHLHPTTPKFNNFKHGENHVAGALLRRSSSPGKCCATLSEKKTTHSVVSKKTRGPDATTPGVPANLPPGGRFLP